MTGDPTRGPLERLERKTTTETLWLYVIAALAAEGPTYAYDVRKRIERLFRFKPSTMTLYTVIYRLEKAGLLKRSKGVYEVTPEGLKALEEGVELLEGRVRLLREALVRARRGR